MKPSARVFLYDDNEQKFGEKVGCVIMASGLGKRFGGNKLLIPFRGKMMIEWILDTTSCIEPRVVVTRHSEIEQLCRKRKINVVLHELPGRNDTVRLGLEYLLAKEKNLTGCIFCPSDQPLFTQSSLERIILKFQNHPAYIYRAGYGDQAGTPVLFPGTYFSELLNLPEGKGGSWLLKQYKSKVKISLADDACELLDIDTREDWERLSSN